MAPCNPNMSLESTRIRTFSRGWEAIRASITEIAAAGFFYLGSRDRVKCWFCNGGLQNWEFNDEPWYEHAKWFPSCEFLLEKKGQEFVRNIVALYPNIQRPRVSSPRLAVLSPRPVTMEPQPVTSTTHVDREIQQNCKICFSSNANIAFIPCGHLFCCFSCSQQLINCPVCRSSISNIIRIYIS